jgi:anti-sigma factor RsiW
MFSAYLDGRVTDGERAFVERHLEVCVDCARHLTTLRATVAAVREMPKVHAPRSFALPRSMAKQSQIAPWLYPFLRAATAVAAFLFALTVAGDLFLRSSLTASTPVALAPTSVVMQSEALRSAQPATAPAVASAPQTSAPPAALAPLATQPKLEMAVPDTATPSIAAAAKMAPPALAEPPVEQPLTGEGMGGGGGPGAPPLAPQPLPAAPTRESTSTPTAAATVASPSPAPTSIARAPEPQPPLDQRRDAVTVTDPAVNPFRIVEDMLAALVLILGVTAWIVHRRSR